MGDYIKKDRTNPNMQICTINVAKKLKKLATMLVKEGYFASFSELARVAIADKIQQQFNLMDQVEIFIDNPIEATTEIQVYNDEYKNEFISYGNKTYQVLGTTNEYQKVRLGRNFS